MKKEPSENDLLKEIIGKLDAVIGTLAVHGKEQKEKINILLGMGLEPATIAGIVGVSANVVYLRKSRARRKK